MCKLLMMSGITDETKDRAWEFIKEMSKEMSSPNCGEKDGIGYAAIDNEGKLFGERWLDNKDAFKHRNIYGSDIDNKILKTLKILTKDRVYSNFGNFNENIRSITMHSRSATGEVSYKNVHPFVEKETSVVHNGVIHNDEKFTKKTSTCDSEVILHEYIKHNIANKPGKFRKIASKLEGYYALGIFSKTSQGLPILDIIKDNSAKLDAFFIEELNTLVFATPKWQSNPVVDACKTLGFTIVSKFEVKDNRLQRLNALTGDIIAYESFKPKERYIQPQDKAGYWYKGEFHSYEKWRSDYNVETKIEEKKYEDIFPRSDKQTNVIEMPKKNEVAVREKQLDDILIAGAKLYSPEEVNELMKEFNEGNEWTMEENLSWKKKNIV